MRRNQLITLSVLVLILALIFSSWISIKEAQKISYQESLRYAIAASDWLKSDYNKKGNWQSSGEDISITYKNLDIPLSIDIFDKDGNVIYENSAETKVVSYRYLDPEIQAVMEGEAEASEVRHSNFFKRDMLYYSNKFPAENLIVRVALPIGSDSTSLNRTIMFVSLIGIAAIILFILLIRFFTNGMKTPLIQLTDKMELLEEGDYSARSETNTPYKLINRLSGAYNTAAASLKEQRDYLLNSKKFLNVLINSLAEPLVVCNRQGDVTFINDNAKEVFQRFIDPVEKAYPLYFLIHSKEVAEQILSILDSGRPEKLKTSLQTADGVRDFSLIISPFQGNQVIIVFHDRTNEVKAEQFRSEFVANVTHELRTPLTSIRGFIDTIAANPDIDRKQRERFMELMDVEALRLERLIQDLLSLSDIEEEVSTLNYQFFDLKELVDEVILQMQNQAKDKKISLIFNADSLRIKADRDRIKQIFINLIDNAITYNREGGYVKISYMLDKEKSNFHKKSTDDELDALVIRVEDDGFGIKPDDQKRIFERFYRVDKSRTASAGGTGLGLSIVKHIVRLYNGDIDLNSKWGRGSIFTITLYVETEE